MTLVIYPRFKIGETVASRKSGRSAKIVDRQGGFNAPVTYEVETEDGARYAVAQSHLRELTHEEKARVRA